MVAFGVVAMSSSRRIQRSGANTAFSVVTFVALQQMRSARAGTQFIHRGVETQTARVLNGVAIAASRE